MDKGIEEYEEIFSSPIEVPLHYLDKHSIDLTHDAPPPDIAITHSITQIESTHVLSEETKFIELIQQVHDILDKSNTKFSRMFLSWRNLIQWGPLLPNEGGMI